MQQLTILNETTISILFGLIILTIYLIVKHSRNKSLPNGSRRPLSKTSTITQKYHYSLKKAIMTPYEQKIFLILTDIFSQKCYIIPQVHLSKLLNHKVKGQNWQGAFSHINGKSVDFVLLRKSTLEPLCAIELDDWTHTLQNRQERDREVDYIFQDVGLPLIRFHDIDKLSKQEIVDSIAQAINH